MTPADIGLCGLLGHRLFFSLLHLHFKKLGAQHVPGHRSIAMLRAVLLAFHDDIGRNVRKAYRRLCLVDVLTAGAAGTHDVGANIIFVDVDLDAVIDHREHHDTGKRRMPSRIGIEG